MTYTDPEDARAEAAAMALIRSYERACENYARARTAGERGAARRLMNELEVRGMRLEAAAKAREAFRPRPRVLVLPVGGDRRLKLT